MVREWGNSIFTTLVKNLDSGVVSAYKIFIPKNTNNPINTDVNRMTSRSLTTPISSVIFLTGLAISIFSLKGFIGPCKG
jgi:hypothetical protein